MNRSASSATVGAARLHVQPGRGKAAPGIRILAATHCRKAIVIQGAHKREIDNQIFKYVGVAGVDKHRIVQVGVAAANLCK
jgi:hypothetical protein